MNLVNRSYTVDWEHGEKKQRVVLSLGDSAKIIDQKTLGVVKKENKKQVGECSSCPANALKRLITGSAKLLKAELGIDACDSNTIIDRRNICESCEDYDFGVCNLCGCFCAAKVKLKSEKCPKGQW